MKKIFFICLSAGFISTGFAQSSSVADVPENKNKTAAPAIKKQPVPAEQKVTAPQPVLNSVGLNAHAQPALQATPVATKPIEATSVEPTTPSRLTGITEKTEAEIKAPAQKPAVQKGSGN